MLTQTRLSFLLGGLLVLAGCGGDNNKGSTTSSAAPPASPTPTLTSISITPQNLTGAPGTTVQLTATGMYSDGASQNLTSAVAWSLDAVSIATVSASGLVTFISAGNATITATSGTVHVSAAITVPTLGVAAVSTSSPLPLTPLSINTVGLNANSPVSVEFADTSGFDIKMTPTRVASDGTVVVGVPLYVDTSGTLKTGAVSLSLTQGKVTSKPATITIQMLPTVASYGVNPGAITHAMLIFQGLLLSQRINALQALREAKGNTVDTTASIASLKQQLVSTIEARSDIDRLILNPGLSIAATTAKDGSKVQFDSSTLDIMDRVQAMFLNQAFGDVVLNTKPTKSNAVPAYGFYVPASLPGKRTRNDANHIPVIPYAEPRLNGNPATKVGQVIQAIQGLNIAFQIPLQTAKALDSKTVAGVGANDPNAILDQVSAIGAGIDAVSQFFKPPQGFAFGTALLSTVNTSVHCITNDASYIYAKATGDDATADIIVQDMANNYKKNIDALVTLTTSWEGWGLGGQLVSSIYGYWTTGRDYYCLANGNASSVCPDQADADTAQQVAQQDAAVFTPPNPGLADITGTVDMQSNLGVQAPDGGIELSPGPGDIDIDALADPSGAFQMYVPLGDSGFNYSAARFSLYDPVTNTALSSEVVDLSNAASSSSVVIPTLKGVCNDDDIDSPDGDDPDCD